MALFGVRVAGVGIFKEHILSGYSVTGSLVNASFHVCNEQN